MNSPALGQINNANDLVRRLASIGTVVIYLLVGLALIYIVYAAVQYFIKGGEGDESRHAASMQIFWGVLGLAVIMSLWGLVNIFVNTFVTNPNKPTPPNADFITNTSATPTVNPYPDTQPTDCSNGPAGC